MHALRFEITPRPGQNGLSELIVGIGDPSKCCLQPKNGQKWFDVKAGDVLVSPEGEERTVLKVRLFDNGMSAGVEIASGRGWPRTRQVPGAHDSF
jgi:hypothetical protein